MHADDLFKKLAPILGDELRPFQAVYMAGDEQDRRNVERTLNLIYANTVTGIHPPPPDIAGTYPLGTIMHGDRALYPFFLRDSDWFHMGIYGQTGRGKTNAMLYLLEQLRRHNVPWLVFDWKRSGYRDLLSKHEDIRVFTVGRRDISPFHINPLTPPPKVDTVSWYKHFIQCLSHAYFLGHGCEMILQDVIGKDTPLLVDVLRKLQVYPAKWRKLQWLQSTERAVKALCYGGISQVFNVTDAPSVTDWLDKNVVLELDSLSESEARFIVDIIMSAIYLYRKEHAHSGLRHVTVIEEAHNVLKKEDAKVEAKSVMDKLFREVREYGESIVIIDQMPSTILDAALANTATQLTFSMKHEHDVRAAGSAMLLDRDEQKLLGTLPVGTAIVKTHRWKAPFMIQIPFVELEIGRTSDEVVRARMAGLFPERKVISPERTQISAVQVISDTDKEGKKLLSSLVSMPLVGISARYKKLQLNPKRGNQYKQQLLRQQLITETSIATSKGRNKLLELTPKGREYLQTLGYDTPESLRHGGIEHQYWQEQLKQKLQHKGIRVEMEHPIGKGQTVDLAIKGRNRTTAIEIETGKSDGLGNIRKCLNAAGLDVICVPTNRDLAKKLQAEVSRLPESESRRVRVIGVWQMA